MSNPSKGSRNADRILFEETLSLGEGASGIAGGTRSSVLLLVAATLLATALVLGAVGATVTTVAGGVDAVLSVLDALESNRPVGLIGLLLLLLGPFLVVVLLIVGLFGRLTGVYEAAIHVRVTDSAVTVQRTDSRYWRSRGVEIPFDTITAVQFLDPDESSLRIDPADGAAERFFVGRRRSWIRIEQETGPAVYVGSDHPSELAEIVAREAPAVEHTTSF